MLGGSLWCFVVHFRVCKPPTETHLGLRRILHVQGWSDSKPLLSREAEEVVTRVSGSAVSTVASQGQDVLTDDWSSINDVLWPMLASNLLLRYPLLWLNYYFNNAVMQWHFNELLCQVMIQLLFQNILQAILPKAIFGTANFQLNKC